MVYDHPLIAAIQVSHVSINTSLGEWRLTVMPHCHSRRLSSGCRTPSPRTADPAWLWRSVPRSD
ncbi:hypothetical protein E2C01_075614 [Portunus trituberculatus]|uniref:Uncharacterized protein n=1 Tax=Portunus trituberculatus TaxID=210409 RepID=A0A5B7IKP7_PORTR|nr:hypothetical protein [Portunus trituberculatus]